MNHKLKILALYLFQTLIVAYPVLSQSTGINTSSPNSKAALDIKPSGKQGFLMPRLSTEDTSLIGVSKNKDLGLMFFDTLIGDIRFWDGLKWKIAGSSAGTVSPWEIDNSDIYYVKGNVGIGTKGPGYPLEVQASQTGYAVYVGNNSGPGLFVKGGSPGIGVSGAKYGLYATGDYAVFGQGSNSSGSWGGHFLNSTGNINAYLGGDYAGVFLGNVGIGINIPTAPLHINSAESPAFRLTDGTQADGNLLISDASGNASWASPSTYKSFTSLNYSSSNDIGTTPVDVTKQTLIFNKQYDATKVEVYFNSRISIGTFSGASGITLEVRIGNSIASIAPAEISITTPGTLDYYSSFSVFGGIPKGSHKVIVYAYTNAGTCSSVSLDPGGWGGRITVKETW